MRRSLPEGRPLTGGWRDDPAWPDVDVVMPIRNEFHHLEAAIASVRAQEYPGRLRIFLGVGPSDDGTEELAARLAEAEDVHVIPNPSGETPAALNAAIRAGGAPVIVRVDGHSVLSDGYVERAVDALRATGAANVGGRQVPLAITDFEQAVAVVTQSWIATGGARYRVGGPGGAVDTVYLGTFDRVALESVGGFDERLARNQDYELNIRLRRSARLVWFEPELAVGYRPRSSVRALARQYFEYGRWKTVVLRLHPRSVRARQLASPIAVLAASVALTLLGRTKRGRHCLSAAVVMAFAGLRSRSGAGTAALAAVTIHTSWGIGFIVGCMLKPPPALRAREDGQAA